MEKKHGRGVAHKTIRIWRVLWTIMLGMKVARGADPSKGVRNRAPAPRHQRWTEGEAAPSNLRSSRRGGRPERRRGAIARQAEASCREQNRGKSITGTANVSITGEAEKRLSH